LRRTAAAVGRTLITVGVLLLLFTVYLLWGTGIYTSQQQHHLRQQFDAALHRVASTTTSTSTPNALGPTTTTAPPPNASLAAGDAVARIQIPKIGLDNIVVSGVGEDDLRKGPGHYPQTPLPGQAGNAAIAGHRTTYGHPFGDIDQLANGDVIMVQTLQGSFTYRVYAQLVVDPSDVAVLAPDPGRPATLTLTTCNPKYSAAQRLVVKAALDSQTKPLPPPPHLPPPAKLTSLGLSGGSGSLLPAFLTGLIAAAVGGLWWLLFHRHPRWTNWLIGVIPFLVALYFFFEYLQRVLPANY